MPLGPGCCHCLGSAVLTLSGACSSGVVAGSGMVITLSGVTVASGTTDSSGVFSWAGAPSTTYTWTATPPGSGFFSTPRFATSTGFARTNSSGVLAVGVTLQAGTGYVCCLGLAHYPIAKTLAYTDGAGTNNLVLTSGNFDVCYTFSGTAVAITLGCPSGTPGGGPDQVFNYQENGMAQFSAYSSTDSCAAGGSITPGPGDVPARSNSTISGAPSGFPLSLSGTYDGSAGSAGLPPMPIPTPVSGGWTITE